VGGSEKFTENGMEERLGLQNSRPNSRNDRIRTPGAGENGCAPEEKPMDLYKAIGELRARKAQVERAIAQMEELLSGANRPKRRGRKSMSEQERAEVSRRMKNYWANRAKQKGLPAD